MCSTDTRPARGLRLVLEAGFNTPKTLGVTVEFMVLTGSRRDLIQLVLMRGLDVLTENGELTSHKRTPPNLEPTPPRPFMPKRFTLWLRCHALTELVSPPYRFALAYDRNV